MFLIGSSLAVVMVNSSNTLYLALLSSASTLWLTCLLSLAHRPELQNPFPTQVRLLLCPTREFGGLQAMFTFIPPFRAESGK